MKATRENIMAMPPGLFIMRWNDGNPDLIALRRAIWEKNTKEQARCLVNCNDEVSAHSVEWTSMANFPSTSDNELEIFPEGTEGYDVVWARVMRVMMTGEKE